jgi:2-succinyl-6-hydroxy-2,4-cyclohexadiene-1-carboxylate synthase
VARFVFLHGFTQTHHHWHAVAHLLATGADPTATLAFVDLPGHGLAADDDRGGIDTIGARLVELAGAGTYVGYSMGGRIALVAATTGDPRIERLVLVGATPGIDDRDERAERRRLDGERAEHLETVGIDGFLDEWLTMPMFARLPPDADGLTHRRSNTVAGLAHSLRSYGTGAQTPLWDALRSIEIPVLVLDGEHDTTFADIGAHAARLLPRATFATVPDAGHAAHTERPTATAALITSWLADLPA